MRGGRLIKYLSDGRRSLINRAAAKRKTGLEGGSLPESETNLEEPDPDAIEAASWWMGFSLSLRDPSSLTDVSPDDQPSIIPGGSLPVISGKRVRLVRPRWFDRRGTHGWNAGEGGGRRVDNASTIRHGDRFIDRVDEWKRRTTRERERERGSIDVCRPHGGKRDTCAIFKFSG